MLIIKILTWWLCLGLALSSLLHLCPGYVDELKKQDCPPSVAFVIITLLWPIIIPWFLFVLFKKKIWR